MSAEVDQLIQTVHDTEGVIDSTIAFIAGIVPQLQAAAGDRAAVLAIATELDAKKTELANAIAAPAPPTTPRR